MVEQQASRSRRFLAGVIDHAVILPALPAAGGAPPPYSYLMWGLVLTILVGQVWALLQEGQSLGMIGLDLKIVRQRTTRLPGLLRGLLLRGGVGGLAILATTFVVNAGDGPWEHLGGAWIAVGLVAIGLLLADALSFMFSPRRCLHDLLSGTEVVMVSQPRRLAREVDPSRHLPGPLATPLAGTDPT